MRNSIIPKVLVYMSFFMCASSIMTPLWAHYVFYIHGDLRTAGIAVGCFSLAYALSSPVMSWIVRRMDQLRAAIPVSYFLYGVFAIGYFYVDSPMELYTVQVLLGISYAIQSASCDTMFGSFIEEGKESFLWGSYSMIYGVAIAIGALVGSHLAHYTSYDVVFGVIVGFAFSAFIIALFLKHPPVSLREHAQQD